MEKSFKEKVVGIAKKKGLDVAEEAAQDFAELALEVVGLIIEESENKYDDMIFMAVKAKAQEALRDLIDKIDGEVDNV